MSEYNQANRDPLTNEPGAHPVGTGLGAAMGGAATGAAVGAMAAQPGRLWAVWSAPSQVGLQARPLLNAEPYHEATGAMPMCVNPITSVAALMSNTSRRMSWAGAR
jgi:hypothetical protein